jgi:phosphate transport system substrate-binding protein
VKRLTMLSAAAGIAAAAIPAVAAAEPIVHSSAKKSTVTMSGSTSVAPLAIKLVKGYLKTHKDIKFKIAQGGSDIGVADVAAGRVSIGNSSRDPKPSDPGGLVFNKIARDGLCMISHSSNNLANLSQSAVQDIFSGKVRDWGDVPGATVSGPIDLVVRTPASGTQDAFQKLFMGSAKVSTGAAAKASNGLVQQAVKTDPHAIGYVSLAFTSGVHNVSYQGVACNLENAKSGQYPGTRNFWMVTRGAAGGAVKKFITWVQNTRAASKIAATEWVPVK